MGGSNSGKVILLGDGTEVLTDQENGEGVVGEDNDRSQREGTPGPEERTDNTPSSTQTQHSESPDPMKSKTSADLAQSPGQKQG